MRKWDEEPYIYRKKRQANGLGFDYYYLYAPNLKERKSKVMLSIIDFGQFLLAFLVLRSFIAYDTSECYEYNPVISVYLPVTAVIGLILSISRTFILYYFFVYVLYRANKRLRMR